MTLNRTFCVAPMMGYTTPYARKLYRILSSHSFLFTEMIASKTLINSKSRDLIIENDFHNPIALQVGGSDESDLALCAKIAKIYNYDEINLNVGCPSKAVQKGSFGACLMNDKNLVRRCIESMQNNNIEVSIKCRIGLGKKLNYEFFEEFVDEISKSGIKVIYVHARNAILKGISPKANRTIPELNYNFVKKIKFKFPKIKFILNGGINSIDKAYKLSSSFDGVMLGRLIQNNPFCLREVDKIFFKENKKKLLNNQKIYNYFDYIKPRIGHESIFRLLSPILQIFFGIPNSKEYKIRIHENIKNKNIELLEKVFLEFLNEKKHLFV